MKFLSDLLKAIIVIVITIQLSVLAFKFIEDNEEVFAQEMGLRKEPIKENNEVEEEKELKGKELIDARLIVSEKSSKKEEKVEYSIDEAEEKIKEENDKVLKESKESKRAIITRTQIAKKRKDNLEKE